MTINSFVELNARRCYSKEAENSWGNSSKRTVSDWALCIAGETGEMCNEVKKFTLYTNKNPERLNNIISETADIITYCFLLLDHLNVDPEKILMEKFDEVSQRIGWKK